MKLVLKVGGHLLDEGESAFRHQASSLRWLLNHKHTFVAVVGGGSPARKWISMGRALGLNEGLLDDIGISVTRLNAYLLAHMLGRDCYPLQPTSLKELDQALAGSKAAVLGGLTPGQSTTAVAAVVAERICADRFVVLTNVDGVFSAKPSEPGSVLLKKVSLDELVKILSLNPALAGTYDLFDDVALKILRRSRIPTIVANGKTDSAIRRAVGKRPLGTMITY